MTEWNFVHASCNPGPILGLPTLTWLYSQPCAGALYLDQMNCYTMLWSNEYCRYIEKSNVVGKPLRFVWGGHNRQTDFGFFGVEPGDIIIPVRVQDGRLYAIGSLKVSNCLHPADYVASHSGHKHFIQNPCANQVLEGQDGKPIRFDIVVPTAILQALRFRSKSSSKERNVQLNDDGKLKNTVAFQGIYRLTEDSANALLNLMDTQPAG